MDLKLALAILTEDSDGIRHNSPRVRYGKWETNSLGFRGKEVDLEKKEGQIRIVCLGGSETFGLFEEEGKEWPSQLRGMLRDQFPRVEVINASVAGLTLKRKKAYVEKYLLPLKPDIMITTQGALLPITDSIRGMESKRLVSKVGGRKIKNSLEADSSTRTPVAVLPKLLEIVKGCSPGWLLTHLRTQRLRRRIRNRERRYLIYEKPMDEVPENIISEFEEDLTLFIRFLEKNRIAVVFLTYPTLFTPSNKDTHKYLLLSIRRLCVELSEDGIIDASTKFNDAIRKIADREKVALIDNDLLIPKTLEYFVDYSHYTNKGAEFIAKSIHHFLNRCEWFKQGAIHRDVEGFL